MLALLGIRRDECKLPIEVIIQFHSICSFACIDYTTLANQSNASRRPVLPQHPSAALDAGLSVLESTHSISALWAQLLLCCWHRILSAWGFLSPSLEASEPSPGHAGSLTLTHGFSFRATIQQSWS